MDFLKTSVDLQDEGMDTVLNTLELLAAMHQVPICRASQNFFTILNYS
jgi:hypothetical protein